MATDNFNFNSTPTKPEVTDKGMKPVKDQHGATPDQIGPIKDLQPPKYPVFDPCSAQDRGVISDGTNTDPIYTNPNAPTPANQDFTDKVNKHIDQVKTNVADEIVYDAQNKWYQGEGKNDRTNQTAPFYVDFKGQGTTTEPLPGGSGPVAPQRSHKVWPYAIPDRPAVPVDAHGYASTDGFIFNSAKNGSKNLEAEAGGGATHGKVTNNVTKQDKPISGGPIGAARGPRADFEFNLAKKAATPADLSPDILSKERYTPNKPEPGMNDGNPPTSYTNPVKKVVNPLSVVDEKAQKDRIINAPGTNAFSYNTQFMSELGQDETVSDEDTDVIK